MIENRVNSFAPIMGTAGFTPGVCPTQQAIATRPSPITIQTSDIYQAAMHRAIEEHEIDKLFNPDPDDFQI
jgi:hypothetical protein